MADENKTERVQLLMTPSELKAIDDWSFENRIRGRAETIRRLCQVGLYLEKTSQDLLNILVEAEKSKDASKEREFTMAFMRCMLSMVMLRGVPFDDGGESPADIATFIYHSFKDETFTNEVKKIFAEARTKIEK